MRQKGFAPIIILLMILLIGGLVGGALYLSKNPICPYAGDRVCGDGVLPSVIPAQILDQTANWKTYNNGKISFNYPNNYIVGGTTEHLFIGHEKGPNGSCIPGGIGIDVDGTIYKNYDEGVKSIISNLDNLQITPLPNGQLFVGNEKPGECGGILNHTALIQHTPGPIVISLEGDYQNDTAVFNQILSTFHFIDNSANSALTKEQALEKVKNLSEVKEYLIQVPNGRVEFDHEDEANNAWVIHEYEIVRDHTATSNWYNVNKETGKITDILGKEY